MTPPRSEEERLREMERKVDAIHQLLVGYDEKTPGLAAVLETLATRVDNLERDRQRIRGGIAVVAMLWAIVVPLLTLLIEHHPW